MKGIHYTLLTLATLVFLGAYFVGGVHFMGLAMLVIGLISLIGASIAEDIINDKY